MNTSLNGGVDQIGVLFNRYHEKMAWRMGCYRENCKDQIILIEDVAGKLFGSYLSKD
jgi:hypothetical protein